jgi:hypothetical protein
MAKNRIVYLVYYRGEYLTHLVISRDSRRKVYTSPNPARVIRVCELVTQRVAQQKMGLQLWLHGWFANVLIEPV